MANIPSLRNEKCDDPLREKKREAMLLNFIRAHVTFCCPRAQYTYKSLE